MNAVPDSRLFDQYLPVAAALVGALVGGLVAEFRTLIQGVRDKRRALCHLLFDLLEIRFELIRSDPRQFLRAVQGFFAKRLGAATFSAHETEQAESALRQVIEEAASRSGLGDEYRKAIEALAPFDPVLAYRLSGRDRLAQVEHVVRDYYSGILRSPVLEIAASEVDQLKQMEAATLDVARSEAGRELADTIRTVAGKLSVFTRFQVGRIIKDQDTIRQKEVDSALDQLITGLAARLALQPRGKKEGPA